MIILEHFPFLSIIFKNNETDGHAAEALMRVKRTDNVQKAKGFEFLGILVYLVKG